MKVEELLTKFRVGYRPEGFKNGFQTKVFKYKYTWKNTIKRNVMYDICQYFTFFWTNQ